LARRVDAKQRDDKIDTQEWHEVGMASAAADRGQGLACHCGRKIWRRSVNVLDGVANRPILRHDVGVRIVAAIFAAWGEMVSASTSAGGPAAGLGATACAVAGSPAVGASRTRQGGVAFGSKVHLRGGRAGGMSEAG
jgi:hypothetical protein